MAVHMQRNGHQATLGLDRECTLLGLAGGMRVASKMRRPLPDFSASLPSGL